MRELDIIREKAERLAMVSDVITEVCSKTVKTPGDVDKASYSKGYWVGIQVAIDALKSHT